MQNSFAKNVTIKKLMHFGDFMKNLFLFMFLFLPSPMVQTSCSAGSGVKESESIDLKNHFQLRRLWNKIVEANQNVFKHDDDKCSLRDCGGRCFQGNYDRWQQTEMSEATQLRVISCLKDVDFERTLNDMRVVSYMYASLGKSDLLKSMLDADLVGPEYGFFSRADRLGHQNIVRMLLQHEKFDLKSIKLTDLKSPSTILELQHRGIDFNAQEFCGTLFGDVPLEYFADYGNVEMVKALIFVGARYKPNGYVYRYRRQGGSYIPVLDLCKEYYKNSSSYIEQAEDPAAIASLAISGFSSQRDPINKAAAFLKKWACSATSYKKIIDMLEHPEIVCRPGGIKLPR